MITVKDISRKMLFDYIGSMDINDKIELNNKLAESKRGFDRIMPLTIDDFNLATKYLIGEDTFDIVQAVQDGNFDYSHDYFYIDAVNHWIFSFDDYNADEKVEDMLCEYITEENIEKIVNILSDMMGTELNDIYFEK